MIDLSLCSLFFFLWCVIEILRTPYVMHHYSTSTAEGLDPSPKIKQFVSDLSVSLCATALYCLMLEPLMIGLWKKEKGQERWIGPEQAKAEACFNLGSILDE